jgi:membrane protease subunit (stomatin/prohibitin family)
MGIIDFVKGGIRELAIARPDEAKDFVVWKWHDTTIPNKAQLTVEPDEIALFFRDGKFQGQLGTGRHALETSNIPFLNKLVDWGTGGNLWIAEVFFVTTREMTGLKFGGKIGKVRDPQSGLPVELMVNGTYSMRVIDPPKLVLGMLGLKKSGNEEFLFWFREQVVKTIKDDIAELMVKKRWPMLDVTSGAYTEEICTEVIDGLRPHAEPYGIEIVRIGNFNLGMKDEDEQRLNKLYENAAYMNMAGGVQGYQQMAAANAMMSAGDAMKNPGMGGGGGGGWNNPLMAGAGLGVGVAFAGQMASSVHPQQQPQQPAPGIPGAGQQAGGPGAVTCAKCGHQVAPGKFCADCGAPMAAAGPKFCSNCGQQVAAGGKFCSGCGTAVG